MLTKILWSKLKVNLLTKNNSYVSCKSNNKNLYAAFTRQNATSSLEKVPTIDEAIKILGNIKFSQSDIDKTRGIVSKLPFRDGDEAINFLKKMKH